MARESGTLSESHHANFPVGRLVGGRRGKAIAIKRRLFHSHLQRVQTRFDFFNFPPKEEEKKGENFFFPLQQRLVS